MDAPSAGAVRDALGATDFPADKEALVAAATEAGADERVVRALRAIPPVDYASIDEVVRSVATA